jgi:DNA replication protein DnaC
MNTEYQQPRKPQPWEAAAQAWSEQHIRTCSCGGHRWVRSEFPIGHELFGKAIPCICQRDESKRKRAQMLRSRSGMGADADAMTFESFDVNRVCVPDGQDQAAARKMVAGIKKACQAYAQRPAGWLMISGVYGCGKTHLATAIANIALAKDLPVYLATVPEMLDVLRDGIKDDTTEQWLDMLQTVDMLILDDLGQGAITDWGREQLYKILHYRHRNNLPVVITTNLTIADIADRFGGAIASRLSDGAEVIDGFSRVLVLPVGDYRPKRRTMLRRAA